MKNKLLAVLATFGMVASASAVKINNNISINGFIDGSYQNSDFTDASNSANNVDSSNTGVDEVELNFLVNAGNVSGELHVDNNGAADGDLDIEQVHFTYSFDNGASVQVGTFGSDLGFEREDPAGLYTFSRAYSNEFNLGDTDNNSGEGVRVSYGASDFTVSVALFNGIGDPEENAALEDDYDTELVLGYTGFENLTLNAGVQTLNAFDTKGGAAGVTTDKYSVNAAYTLNKLLLAGEYTSIEADGAQDRSGYLVLANYAVSNKLGVTLRYSEWESSATEEKDKLSFAPSYSITDSLGAIVEFSTEETSGGANAGDETDSLAVELTYTF